MLSREDLFRYNRQILLPEFGPEGQQRLKEGSVLVIGAGGLGSPALLYLTAAGVGRIGIVDFDLVEESNLQRQVLFATRDVGSPKALLAGDRLRELNPSITIETHFEHLTSKNALELISRYELIIDGSDNLPTRYLVNDACVLAGKTLVYGALFQFEGQVTVFNQPQKDGTRGPNYRDLFPEPPPPEMVPSCSTAGVLGVLPGIIGSMQAMEAIKVIAGIGQTLSGRLMIFDGYDFSTRYVTFRPDPTNPISGKNPSQYTLIEYEEFCNPSHGKVMSDIKEISPLETNRIILDGEEVQLVDVRELFEFELVNIGGTHIPLGEIGRQAGQIRKDIPVVVLCKSGQRSRQAILQLQKELGLKNLMNLKGGIMQWRMEVDPELPLY